MFLSRTNESVIELQSCIGSALSERVGLQEVGGFISKGESWAGVSHQGRWVGVTCMQGKVGVHKGRCMGGRCYDLLLFKVYMHAFLRVWAWIGPMQATNTSHSHILLHITDSSLKIYNREGYLYTHVFTCACTTCIQLHKIT